MLAYDEETGEQAYKEVVRLFRNETKEWYHVRVNGEEIVCTGGHPFYVPSLKKFVRAKELTVGTELLLSDGSHVTIEEIRVEKLETLQRAKFQPFIFESIKKINPNRHFVKTSI